MIGETPPRPYDPEQLQKLTQHMLVQSPDGLKINPVVSLPLAVVAPTVEPRGPRYYLEKGIGLVNEAGLALSGLSKALTLESRITRATKKAETVQHRINVVRVVGETIDNPRGQRGNPIDAQKEKIGWVGVHKREIGASWRPEDYANLGFALFRKTPPTATRPNLYRPAARPELAATKQLEDLMTKRSLASNDARWLRDSYSLPASQGQHRLSAHENRHLNRVSRKADRLDRKAARATQKFNKITGSSDRAGRAAHRELKRIPQRIERMQQRHKHRQERKEGIKRVARALTYKTGIALRDGMYKTAHFAKSARGSLSHKPKHLRNS